MILMLLACTGGGTPPGDDEDAQPGDEATAEDEALEQLRALGYVDHAEEVADVEQEGVVVIDAAQVQPGYRLYVSAKECEATLLRHTGEVVREWSGGRRCYNWSNAELGPDGTLYVLSRERRHWWQRKKEQDFQHTHDLVALDFNGEVRWRASDNAHHDVHVARDGQLYALTITKRRIREVHPAHVTLDDGLARLDPQGELQQSWSFYDMLAGAEDKIPLQHVGAAEGEDEGRYIDLFHTNAVDLLEDPALAERGPLYKLGQALITFRHQDILVLFDLATGAPTWRWGRGDLDGPHDAQLIDNGNVLVFDNGLRRGWSRVLEVDPVARRIVWQYGAKDEGDPAWFYTRGRGSAQRLPNGNTLIADSNNGEALEVTPGKEVVWRFYNPVYSGKYRSVIVRMKHYPSEMIEPLLAR